MQYSLVRPIIRMSVPLAVIACGSGPGPKGAPAPSSAGFRTDSVAVVSLSIPGTPQVNWNTINHALTDSSYRYADGDFRRGVMRFRSLVEGRLIQVEMRPVGPDSVAVRITGQTYAGGSRTRILAADSAWPATHSTDPASTSLQTAATRIRAEFNPSSANAATNSPAVTRQVAPTLYQNTDSLLRDLADGRKAFCKANTFMREVLLTVDNVNLNDWCTLPSSEAERWAYNTYVLQNPDSTRVGDAVEVCSYSSVPLGFEILEWFTDAARCPFDPWWVWKAEPNMMRLKRWR